MDSGPRTQNKWEIIAQTPPAGKRESPRPNGSFVEQEINPTCGRLAFFRQGWGNPPQSEVRPEGMAYKLARLKSEQSQWGGPQAEEPGNGPAGQVFKGALQRPGWPQGPEQRRNDTPDETRRLRSQC